MGTTGATKLPFGPDHSYVLRSLLHRTYDAQPWYLHVYNVEVCYRYTTRSTSKSQSTITSRPQSPNAQRENVLRIGTGQSYFRILRKVRLPASACRVHHAYHCLCARVIPEYCTSAHVSHTWSAAMRQSADIVVCCHNPRSFDLVDLHLHKQVCANIHVDTLHRAVLPYSIHCTQLRDRGI